MGIVGPVECAIQMNLALYRTLQFGKIPRYHIVTLVLITRTRRRHVLNTHAAPPNPNNRPSQLTYSADTSAQDILRNSLVLAHKVSSCVAIFVRASVRLQGGPLNQLGTRRTLPLRSRRAGRLVPS